MPSNTPLTDAINALTTYSNTVTGASDTTLSDAVGTLVAGYGGGGGYSLEDVIKHNYSGEIVYTGTDDIKNYTFSGSAITKLWLPNCKNLGGNAAESCQSLKILYVGGGTDAQIGSYAVRSCSALEQLRIPYMGEYRGFGGYALQGCTSLRLIDYGSCRTLAFNSLPACPLDTIIVRNTNIVAALGANSLNNSTAFQNGGTGGKVYVPSAYLSQYPTAANWSTYYGYGTMQFLALEGSPYEQPDFEVTL